MFFMICDYFDCRDIIVPHLSLSRMLDSENKDFLLDTEVDKLCVLVGIRQKD